jgi:hypothetical protein
LEQKAIRQTLDSWAEALGTEPKTLYTDFEAMLADEKEVHPQFEQEQLQQRALRRVRIRAKREHGPMAFASGTADAVILGVSGLIDTARKLREDAIALYRENPAGALKMGVVDAKGQPIDTRKSFEATGQANPFYGRPLRAHNMIQLVAGIVTLEQDGTRMLPRPFVAIVDRNDPASKQPPLFHRVKFPFTSYQDDETIFAVERQKGEKITGLRVRTPRGVEFEDAGPVDPVSVVQKYCPEIVVPLEQLEEWAQNHGQRELVAVEGDVVRLDMTPNPSTQNRRIQIDNGHDITGFGTTIWVPTTVPIDFAEESAVFAFGNARAGAPDSTFGASVNAMGLYALPDYKMALPEGLLPIPEPSTPSAELADPSTALGEPPELEDVEEGRKPKLTAKQADAIFGTGTDDELPPVQKPSGPGNEAEAVVMCLIAKNGSEANGLNMFALQAFAEKMKVNRASMERAVEQLIARGRIYEPKLGIFKVVSEPSKEELAIYKKRGGI